MNKKPTLPKWPEGEDEVDLSNLGPDDAPELTPEDGEWRLVGRLEDGAIHTRLVPALGH